ncbi:MAG: DUF6702 family protein [Telluria sp.]
MFKAALIAILFCVSTTVDAHDFHVGLTELSFNARTGSTEVVHTLMAHDVDQLMSDLYQRQLDFSDPDDEALLRKYVESRFTLLDKDGKPLPLHWVGVKAEADTITVFAELEHTPLDAVRRVRDGLLSDYQRAQLNTLNVRASGAVRTLTFTADKTEQELR